MSRPEGRTRRFVIDTNAFVAAIKPFTRTLDKQGTTKTFDLLIRMLIASNIKLNGNQILIYEYRRLAQELHSPTASLLLDHLVNKVEIIDPTNSTIRRCRPYLPKEESADVLHAATCLQTGSTLITNDADFDRIKAAGIIEVWDISDAIRQILSPSQK